MEGGGEAESILRDNRYIRYIKVLHFRLLSAQPLLKAGIFHNLLPGQRAALDGAPPKFMSFLEPQIVT